MATKYYEFSGEIQWANNLTEADAKFPTNDGSPVYRGNIKLDPESQHTFGVSGLRLKAKEGVITFRRPEFKIIKGEKVEFGPPKVFGVPEGVLVANGSKVTAKVVVYDSRMGKGHRLESVTVTDLIEYQPEPKPADEVPAF